MFARFVILAALLPYIQTSPLGSDIQPHFYIALAGYIAFKILDDGVMPFSGSVLFVAIITGGAGIALGAGVNTLALFTFPIAIAFFARQDRGSFLWAIKCAIIIYLIGLCLEIIVPNTLHNIVSNQRSSFARGMTSFTSEPSYLGLIALAFVVALLHFHQSYFWVILSCLLALASGSLTAIAPLVVILVLANLRQDQIHIVAITLLGVAVFYFAIIQTDTRMGVLLRDVSRDFDLIWQDQSFSNRIARALAPIASAWQSGFLPHAFPTPGDIDVNFEFLSATADTEIERLSSLATVMIYVFGVTSFPLIAAYILIAKARLFLIAAIAYFAVTNISISTPYLYLLLSLPLMHRFVTVPAYELSTQNTKGASQIAGAF
ncbi:hypothetical protein BFP76_11415 [Amylibacter kogurei]|uniref:Uncharacterized protein n=1 Tax=Paramylibacter kogurei TaxID=1889778 RepID=A0A2G5KCD3_9RHOB|nr:hypothetical protein [Amylibacter kogurei]PIB26510.1 hypothetical protein BFP76_11415 [Amylibacter kogurei]